jgi:hypothetical protein
VAYAKPEEIADISGIAKSDNFEKARSQWLHGKNSLMQQKRYIRS